MAYYDDFYQEPRQKRGSTPQRRPAPSSRQSAARGPRYAASLKTNQPNKRRTSGYQRGGGGRFRLNRLTRTILMDLALTIAGLLIFLLFQRVLHSNSVDPTQLPNTSPVASAPLDGTTPSNGGTTTSAGPFASKFPDKFTTGEVEKTDTTYKSQHLNITITQGQRGDAIYYLADIYVSDIKYLKTAFAGGKYGGGTASIADTLAENNGILGINGDYYSARNDGIVIRNGELYREKVFADVLIMNNDGSMATYTADAFDIDTVKQNGAWQGWSFGPMLLQNGQPMTEFNSNVVRANPRTAIGYYEPGHYCFIVVDGRQPGYSEGLAMADLSQLMYDLGCKVAYNFDGGQTSMMVFDGKVVNKPYKDGRSCSDIVYVGEGE